MRPIEELLPQAPRFLRMSYSRTMSRRHRRVCTEPLHVTEGPDGAVLVFFPDGRSVALTVEAAAQSTLLLARTVRRANAPGEAAPHRSATVIPVDFLAGSRVR